jgi:uncharacterized membrane protein
MVVDSHLIDSCLYHSSATSTRAAFATWWLILSHIFVNLIVTYYQPGIKENAMIRVVLLILHIIFAGLWMAQFPIVLIFSRAIAAQANRPAGVTLLHMQIRLQSIMGMLAGVGILVTGLGLTFVSRWGVVNIGGFTPDWLLVKQIVYSVLLVIVFAGIMPASRRLIKQFNAQANGNPSVTPEMGRLARRIRWLGYLEALLIVVNITVAVWKPFFR